MKRKKNNLKNGVKMKVWVMMIITLLFITNHLTAQVGPNIVAGAGSVAFNKGELDAQLIMELIATKKGEIKTELGKRLVLSKIENGSFTFYNYAEKNLDIIFNEANKEIIMKELMRNSAELMLVYGITEFYLNSWKYKTNLTPYEIAFIDQANAWVTAERMIGFLTSINKNLNRNNMVISHVPNPANNNIQLQNYKLTLLPYLTNNNPSYRESSLRLREVNTNYNMSHVLVDMVFEVCRNNHYVLQTGLFQNNNFSEERDSSLNKFLIMRDKSPDIYNSVSPLKAEVDSLINNLFRYYSVLNDLSNVATLDAASISSVINALTNNSITPYTCIAVSLQDLKNNIRALRGNELLNNSDLAVMQNKLLQKLTRFLFIGAPAVSANLADYRYFLEKEIIPQIVSVQNTSNNDYSNLLNSCMVLSECLHKTLLTNVQTNIVNFNVNVVSVQNYLSIISCLNNLDKAESYDYIFKFITNLAETYGSQEAKTIVRWITSCNDRYATINTETNKMTIDVEAIAGDFYNRFGKNQQTRLNFLLSVGVNHSWRNGSNYTYIIGSDTATLRQQSFVSEKVGLRFNIIDVNRKRFFGNYDLRSKDKFEKYKRRAARMNKSPLIDNWHVQAFASGLLYQINSLNSEDNFKKPLFGLGTGLTFYNGLDISANYMMLYNEKAKNGFFNIAFDISFMEYLSELKKKKSKA